MKAKETFIRFLVVSFSLWYGVFSVSIPYIASASEEAATEAEVSPTPSPSSSPSPSPSAETESTETGDVTIETGDATAVSSAESDANDSTTEVSGSLDGGTCEGTTSDCEGDTTVIGEQEGEVDTSSSSTSATGDNEAETQGDVSIDTGNALSGSASTSETNTNEVSLVDGEDNGGEEPSPSPSPSASPVSTLSVLTEQIATSSSESTAASDTGGNLGLSGATLEILTGLAYSIASIINVANINVVGSDLIFLFTTILGSEEQAINLYEMVLNFKDKGAGTVPQETIITTNQSADLSSENTASANTGENSGGGEEGQIVTGDGVAVANTVNLANLNLVGTNSVFAVFNIIGSLVGDIILPNGSHLSPADFPWGQTSVISDQTASVESSATTLAETGENGLGGVGVIETGDATAYSNATSFVNLVRVGNAWYLLFINHFGDWTGSLRNWNEPGGEVTVLPGSHQLEKYWEVAPEGSQESGGSLSVVTNQEASVRSDTGAFTNTGRNSLLGNGLIKTGNAFSLANDFTLANFVGVGGSFFFGVFNILGRWVGDLVVAYPDLVVDITDGLDENEPGGEATYMITLENTGDAKAEGVDLTFLGHPDFEILGGETSWQVSEVLPGERLIFNVRGRVSGVALAGTTLTGQAVVGGTDTEETSTNNFSEDTTTVVLPVSVSASPDTRLPNLAVKVSNNVGEFIYPGDTVRAKIVVANQSEFTAKDVKVYGELTNDHPMPAVPMGWKLGDMQPGERVMIEFEVKLIEGLPEGQYHLAAQAVGESASGDESSSGWTISNFLVKLKGLADLVSTPAFAEEGDSSSAVLGASSEKGFDIRKYFPYILLLTLPSLLLVSALRRRMLGLPLLPLGLRRKKKDEN